MKSCYHGYKATSEDNVYKLKYDKDQPHTLREIKKMLRLVLLKTMYLFVKGLLIRLHIKIP